MKPGKHFSISSLLSIAAVLASRGGGAVASVIALLLMTRSLAPADVGILVTVQSFALIAGLAITLNLEAAALRALPGADEKEPGTSAAYFRLARKTILVWLPITVIAVALWFALQLGLRGAALFLAVLTVPCGAGLRFGAFTARALGEVRRSAFYSLTLRPALFAFGLAVIIVLGSHNLTSAMAMLFLGFAIAAGLQLLGLAQLAPRGAAARADADTSEWRRTGIILMVSFLLAEGFSNTAILAASTVLDEAELARLAVSLRMAFLINMAPAAIMMAMSPALAQHLKRGEIAEAGVLARRITLLGSAIVIVAVLISALLSTYLLALFGGTYAGDRALLITLLIIPLVSALTGPALPSLTVKGENRTLFRLAIANIAVLAAAIAVGGQFGLMGVGTGIVVAHAAWRFSVYFASRAATGLNPLLSAAPKTR